MTAVVSHPSRFEREVAADAAMAALRSLQTNGYLQLDASLLELVAVAVGVTVGDLRDADLRRITHRVVLPQHRPTLTGAMPEATPLRPPPNPRRLVELRSCSRCGATLLDEGCATCRRCRERDHAREAARQAEARAALRDTTRALATVADLELDSTKTAFVWACRRCHRPIAEGEAVEHVQCPGEPGGAA